MAIAVGLVGLILTLVGTIMLLIEAFRVGIVWGLFVLFCHPIGPLLFIIIYWDKAKSAVGYYLLGWILLFVANGMPGGRAWHRFALSPRAHVTAVWPMAAALMAVGILGAIVHAVGYFWLVVLAYREAPGAGRAALFIWPLAFLVPLMRWDEVVLKAFLLAVIGLAMAWGGFHFIPDDPPPAAGAAHDVLPR